MRISEDNPPIIGEYYRNSHEALPKAIYQVVDYYKGVYKVKWLICDEKYILSDYKLEYLLGDVHLPCYSSPLWKTLLGCEQD